MMDRAAAWFHLMLALAVATIVHITVFSAHWPGFVEPVFLAGTAAR
jgi:hypothetical protein